MTTKAHTVTNRHPRDPRAGRGERQHKASTRAMTPRATRPSSWSPGMRPVTKRCINTHTKLRQKKNNNKLSMDLNQESKS